MYLKCTNNKTGLQKDIYDLPVVDNDGRNLMTNTGMFGNGEITGQVTDFLEPESVF